MQIVFSAYCPVGTALQELIVVVFDLISGSPRVPCALFHLSSVPYRSIDEEFVEQSRETSFVSLGETFLLLKLIPLKLI